MRILFITSTRIGDAVLSTGLLNYLYQKYPDAKFTIASGAVSAPLFEHFPGLERLIAVNKKPFSLHWLALWSRLFYKRWDIVVDLRRSAITQMLFVKNAFRAKRLPGKHKVEELAATLNLKTPPDPVLWPGKEHHKKADKILASINQTPILGLGATANWVGKQWSPENFARLAKRLTNDKGLLPGAKIVIFGAESERAMVKPLLDSLPPQRTIDLVGGADLLTAYCILQRSDLFVGNDTGIMHIAAASGVPTVGLYGPSREDVYGPWGKYTAIVRTQKSYKEIVTSTDFNHRIPRSYMNSLLVDDVVKTATKLYKKATRQQKKA